MIDTSSTPELKAEWIGKVYRICKVCRKCPLSNGITQVVPGIGPADSRVMIIGEAPGAEEDEAGIPFCGRAGQLLSSMIEQAGSNRDNIFITNAVKCRPPQNRDPETSELDACWSYLQNQILIIRPRIIVMVGRIATAELLSRVPDVDFEGFKITKDHGRIYTTTIQEYGYCFGCMPILHPSYLLRGMKQKEIGETINDLATAFEYAYS